MSLSTPMRSMLLVALALGVSACGGAEQDPDRFVKAAEKIASIPLNNLEAAEARPDGPKDAEDAGLRPLRVELMTPHQLWDARDGIQATANRAAATETTSRPAEDVGQSGEAAKSKSMEMAAIQLGAYASQAAAQTAWGRLGPVTQGLSPVFEPAMVNGRPLVRLKVRAGQRQAEALCAVAAASDAWCLRAAAQASSTGST